MSLYLSLLSKEFKPKLHSLFDDYKNSKDKDFFKPTGTQVYVGMQGSGKTISAVKHVYDLKKRYPKSILVTNLNIEFLKQIPVSVNSDIDFLVEKMHPDKQYLLFSDAEELSKLLVSVNNNKFGVIYLIDEIHLYFNALGSLNVPMYVFTEISQQRKQRKVIIGTSQLFMRMAKPFREQCDNIILCSTRFGFITKQTAYDGATLNENDGQPVGDKRKIGWFFQTRQIRSLFDTYQKVISGLEQYEQNSTIILEQPKKRGLFRK